ncbi:MAG: b(o/a)3-type cytochrome-c oxidase subunit 1 [Azospirillaceae bacterium]|nr:b(o/a)3-type cytochrome-c oxidase subunit 1 [Azospirillaceae bacterium]
MTSKRLILAHFWLAFAGFAGALLLGEWQMFIRSPLHAWISNPEWYYRSVTAHGTAMAYVLPTLVAMGFGYFITEAALKRPLIGQKWAWAGFGLALVGTVTAVVPVAAGKASVLYTFYPPLIGSPFYYIGVVLVVVGSWIWVALMAINLYRWKKDNPGAPVPLAMFANVAGSYLWAWTAVGAAIELLFQILPVALGLKTTIDAGLARVFFSWTLHAIVYFWLMPTYIAYYTIVPRAIGGRLYSDSMGRLSFILFLVVAMPIGIHHLFMDPQVGAGFKFLHSVFTALVALPTLLTVFTICASVEIAARLRGGKGVLGWIRALPWRNPMMLALAFSFVMLGFGGAGGLINMSYQLDSTIHNTQWITGHFHLIFGGAIVIMYFAIAYDVWPHLTGRALECHGLMRAQLWTWFVGMMVLTFPWHWVGILSMPRRMAYYDYTDPVLAAEAIWVVMSTIGGAILVVSGILFLTVLIRGHRAPVADPGPYRFAVAVHQAQRVPVALNSYGLWLSLMLGLTLINYGFPIIHLLTTPGTNVPAITVGAQK